MPTTLTEARPAGEAIGPPGANGRINVVLITPGWGSSGYYAADVLEQAAQDKVWPAGTQCYVDHPTSRELNERPERSVKDLAAVLTEDARWDEAAQALVAPAQLLPTHAEVLSQPEMADAIGMSIRASADVEMGEAEGRRGRIVKQLVYGESVDFVTRAGRGGRYQVIESATPSRVVNRAVHRGVDEATANELRDGLQQALRDAYGAEQSWVWVRDFDDTHVWFEHETPDGSGVFQHDYSETDGAVTLTGDPVEVRAETRYVPVTPAGQPPTQESQEDTMPQIEEGRLAQLEEAAGRVLTLEAERDAEKARADKAEQVLAEASARQSARPAVIAKVAESKTLGPRTQARLVESIVAALPVADGKVDDQTLADTVKSAVEAAEAEAADYVRAGQQTGPLFGSYGSAQESGQPGQFDQAAADQRRRSVFGVPTVKGA